ncbi:MAG TPA: ATP-binding protein [Thermoanaerobaculia bacterium]|nr:ATP-binding protein [Thermoanaerobaculia bacterium]
MAATRLRIFVSSVQKEFAEVRANLKTFLLGDAVLRRFIAEVFLFEELPASDRRADEVYLAEVDRSDIYLGIFGNDYGFEDAEGIAPTEREYDRATQKNKTRLIYVWGSDDDARAPKMRALIKKASSELIRRRIEDGSALTAEVYASLVDHLDRRGALRIPPFDTSAADRTSIASLSRKRISWFLETASRERNFPMTPKTSTKALLTHLNLLSDGKPTNAAILLFGAEPQRVHRTAETKCVQSHGTEYQRPFVSYQIYGGDVFEQADQARDFVLSRINRSVGTRSESITATAEYELPRDAVAEAIINAIVHRDYNSNASVEVRLFSDRLEVWNPGVLPGTLTTENLREDHASVPNNPLIADPMYLARYIEKAGTGTQLMISLCLNAGLPEPDFEERSGSIVVTLWRDWLTNEVMNALQLNDRQVTGLALLRADGKITRGKYQVSTGAGRTTAARDLEDMMKKGVIERRGERRGSFYVKSKGMTHK